MHDAQVFKGSGVYQRHNEIFPESDYFINDVKIPFLLIGDPAYPGLPWLLKDYPGGGLDEKKNHFNHSLNRSRVKVEQAFGMLKKMFRILGVQSEIDVKFMPLVVTACCTLYNIIYNDLEPEIEEVAVNTEESNDEPATETSENERPSATATNVRDTIADFLMQ